MYDMIDTIVDGYMDFLVTIYLLYTAVFHLTLGFIVSTLDVTNARSIVNTPNAKNTCISFFLLWIIESIDLLRRGIR
jgi:hypothetical protein